ncbi:MAG TPA: malto-oligosyltrehalose synthase [Nitrosomonas nitrosa]|nr:malto-oligosyltrehalose synthase [Nitrosomonas nitrosa]
MKRHSLLERLCTHYQIAGEYQDIWGKHHPASKNTKRALLTAMGVSTENDKAMENALVQVEMDDFCRALPPVQVVRNDVDCVHIEIGIPEKQAGHRFRWRLIYENNDSRDGEFRIAELELLAQQVVKGENWQRYLLVLAEVPDLGYHSFELYDLGQPDAQPATMSLIVAPCTCYQPEAIRNGGRVWGFAVQLYAVRSSRNWGIGDYTDLVRMLEFSAQAGAGLVGLNPLHALFPHNPEHASPYSPSSRLFLNCLYLDIEVIPDFAECSEARQYVSDEAFQAQLRALRAAELVDYAGVAQTKMPVLNILYNHFRRYHLNAGSEYADAFHHFREEQGVALYRHALHEALQEWLHRQSPDVWGWPVWPEPYRHPESEAVAVFAAENEARVTFFEYLQWQAHSQLQAAGHRAYELGLDVGLYQDLAVSVDVGGAEAWSNQDIYALQARIGSPPDDFNLKGQDWGLPPWSPKQLREQAYAPFIATLRQNMRAAGALRIDHVMALRRLLWVPSGKSPADGAYVHYPFEDLLGILALESQRNLCLVIGEDLGTVPDDVREALHPLGVLSYRLFYFEKTVDGRFKSPNDFEPQALVAVTTHDLPTLAGYWLGLDLELRKHLDLFPNAGLREHQIIERAENRARLLIALERENLLPAGINAQPVTVPEMTTEFAIAIHRYLARTPSQVMITQLEDILGQVEQINLPGTIDQYPNWRRKLPLDLELWGEDLRVIAFGNALRDERGGAVKVLPETHPYQTSSVKAIIPRSTYRWQFHQGFTFEQGTALVSYLDQLGISHCYASPCLQARPASSHGYDIIDHNRMNMELGGEDAFTRFTDVLEKHHVGLILDIVPNHMGVMGSDNAWWLDVLENGAASVYATFFDIDWDSLKDTLRGKVLVPILGDHYGNVLDQGELKLAFDSERGIFYIRYYEHMFPIDPQEYPRILALNINQLKARLEDEDLHLMEFRSLITAFGNLPQRSETGTARIAERARDKEVHKATLARLYHDADIARFIDENLREFNDHADVGLLHELMDCQAWRLASWRVASDEINYRRFFDINDLAALRMENPQVFEATHKYVLELVAKKKVQGLRIDHPDGLYNPAAYFHLLQAQVAAPQKMRVAEQYHQIIGETPPAPAQIKPIYLFVEKILARYERLRDDWAVHGTTGYDFTNLLNGLFVDAAAESKMDRVYREFIGYSINLEALVYDCKKLIMHTALASELNVLALQLSRIAELDRHTRDFTLNSLREVLRQIVACFPVYRTYVQPKHISEEDRRYVDWAVNVSKKRAAASDNSVFDFVREVLLIEIAEGKHADYRKKVINFARKFQQYTGPVMAKGLEDTVFYRYNRLLSLNEVGGEPDKFGVSVSAFHHQNQERAQNWPHAMLSTSTHDGKRSEDVRARINVLTELPDEWRSRVRRWARLNRNKKRLVDDQPVPVKNDEYFFYQTLVGVWPLEPFDQSGLEVFRKRIETYMLKAAKEAKLYTSWVNPNAEYEAAIADFVHAVLGDIDNNLFLADFLTFLQPLNRAGLFNSLSQTLLKLTSPGVPDIYQGNELWDFSLVDPDNRRPVDYQLRRMLLVELEKAVTSAGTLCHFSHELVKNIEDGRAKLYLTWRTLQLRRDYSELFREGDYLPLDVSGAHADHICAFARRLDKQIAIVVAPRLVFRLAGDTDPLGEQVWNDTRIMVPFEKWQNWLTGEHVKAESAGKELWLSAGSILRYFPVALLLMEDKS